MDISTTLPLASFRASILVQLFEWSKAPYKFLFKQGIQAWKTNMADLSEMEPGSLGKDLYEFMKLHQFQIEAKLESHDVAHVLLQYPTDVVSEISMQFFFLGNHKRSLYTKACTLLGALVMPEYYDQYYKAYKRGQESLPIHQWKLEHLLKEKTICLRALIFNQEQENTLYI